jgi:hypothetical protein
MFSILSAIVNRPRRDGKFQIEPQRCSQARIIRLSIRTDGSEIRPCLLT